ETIRHTNIDFLFVSFLTRVKMLSPTNSTLFPYTTLFRSNTFINDISTQDFNNGEYSKPAPDENKRAAIMTNPLLEPVMSTPLARSEEHTSELQSRENLVCRLLLEKKTWTTAASMPAGIRP